MDFTPNRRKAVLGGLGALAMAGCCVAAAVWISGMPRHEGDAATLGIWLLSVFALMCAFAAAIQLVWWRPEQLRIDEVGIRIVRGGKTVQLPWEELDRVGVVPVRFGSAGFMSAATWNTWHLAAWPTGDASPPRGGRSQLWDSRAKAYTLDVETFREPPSAVEAALARYAGNRYRAGEGVG